MIYPRWRGIDGAALSTHFKFTRTAKPLTGLTDRIVERMAFGLLEIKARLEVFHHRKRMERETAQQSPSQDRSAEPVAKAILGFLEKQQRPITLEQIAEWWMSRQSLHVERSIVAKAVERLAEQGLLEVLGHGPSRRYRFNGVNGATEDAVEKGD